MTRDTLLRAEALLARARACTAVIVTAESCTAGLLAGAITAPPGASEIFERGFVTYSNAAKVEMLGVLPATLDQYGAVSEPVAAQMAKGALARSSATLAVSVTGIAGPGGSDHKPEGRVCFGIATAADVSTQTMEFGALGRAAVRQSSVDHALDCVLAALSNAPA